jgi:hypothetical protein
LSKSSFNPVPPNHTRGLIQSFEAVDPQLQDVDFITQVAKLDVPVYIFAGRNDVNAMSSLVEEYFSVLEAPHKELIWLNGGHGLVWRQPRSVRGSDGEQSISGDISKRLNQLKELWLYLNTSKGEYLPWHFTFMKQAQLLRLLLFFCMAEAVQAGCGSPNGNN